MKVSKNSKYQTHKKSFETLRKTQRSNWRAKRGPFWIFNHPLLQNIKKIEGGTLWEENFSEKKVSQCRNKLKSGTL